MYLYRAIPIYICIILTEVFTLHLVFYPSFFFLYYSLYINIQKKYKQINICIL